ncbi:MAG: branched-chain amino acid ABC transporter permease [Deltaproteobacteria bacterium]|nr:branched-chain amino acid ABC transporter permease [Deltaproteobacteria bacterium]
MHKAPYRAAYFGPYCSLPKIQAYGFIVCMVVIALLISFYKYTRTGLGMRVVHEDHLVAQNLGINVKRIFQFSWIFSCMVAVIAGMLLGNIQGVGLDLDANGLVAIAAVLFGGMESFGGAVIAGLAIGIIQIFVIQYLGALMPGEITMLVPFVFLLLILIIKPYGLFGLVRIERL